MQAEDIRKAFINYFLSRGHKEIPGSSLIPENDPSVLFTTAGMHPLVPYLLGESHPLGKRLVNYQKCLRTDDINEVGDDIHLTFFEMLGNWSLGDYFKEDTISMSYDFLINHLGLDPSRLAVTVFEGDKDAERDTVAAKVWHDLGIPYDRIYYYGKKENWWGPAGQTGPCGPDTEIFYDSLKPKCSANCGPSCGCGKYWEIWNDVFMQYDKGKEENFLLLKNKNVDTGLGLERITAIMEGKESIYETELFRDIAREIRQKTSLNNEKSTRVIADHLRAACFVLSDGVLPSNVDQGYILRRLIRRSIRHMRNLGVNPDMTPYFGTVIIDSLKGLYPELELQRGLILDNLTEEKDRFAATLERGEKKLVQAIDNCKKSNINLLGGKTVFNLYDTFGFPPEITEELAAENGIFIDRSAFDELYRQHQEKSRQGANHKFKGGLADNTVQTESLHTATHILHKALKIVLGSHVKQKGSNITQDRLRFDFNYDKKMSQEEIEQVEDIVNFIIEQDLLVTCEEMPLEKAREIEAEGLFNNKYGETVKVYSIGDFSKEICQGPHVDFTSSLGTFKITQEQGVGAGVRRIKAVLLDKIEAKSSENKKSGDFCLCR